MLLPIDYALLAQFVGFTGMYFADSIATTKGWAPKWYMTYRFLLTFVVGASVVVTLVGRGQVCPAVNSDLFRIMNYVNTKYRSETGFPRSPDQRVISKISVTHNGRTCGRRKKNVGDL